MEKLKHAVRQCWHWLVNITQSPLSGKGTHSRHRSHLAIRLEELPTEIILRIAAFLQPDQKAAMALTCKAMLGHLGTGVLVNLSPDDRYKLLLHLAEDGMYLPDILCHWCRIFHSPMPTPGWSVVSYTDPANRIPPICESFTKYTEQKESSIALPWRLHYNLVMAVMFCHRRGFEFWEPHHLDHDGRTIATKQGHKLKMRYRFKISHGNLILKTEKLLYLGNQQGDVAILQSIAEITEMLNSRSGWDGLPAPQMDCWERDKVCRHSGWTRSNPHIFDTVGFDNDSEREDMDQITPMTRLTNWTAVKGLEDKTTQIKWCKRCYTDLAIALIPMPASNGAGGSIDPSPRRNVNICVLTSWKNLGTGLTITDNMWNSHLIADGTRPDKQVRYHYKGAADVDPSAAWEGARSKGRRNYVPSIDRVVLLELEE